MKITYSNDTIVPEDVIRFLSLTGQSQSIYNQIIIHKEVVKKAREMGMEITDDRLQQFADNYRSLRGLYSAQEMLYFLDQSGLTEDEFEAFCESSLLIADFKDRMAKAKKIEEYFINNRSEFDLARISIIAVDEEGLANEIAMQVAEDGEDFHALARRYSLDETTKYAGGYVGAVSRKMLSPEIAAKVFSADSGDLLGPFQKEQYQQLIWVEEVIKPELNDHIKEMIKERIFAQWVSQFFEEGVNINI
ncbi:MAG: peptidylprolyl isomerase [Deltaproteobacteria bacterium]|nr:peptidylprolyl isomerase [Deltaproteobacteria bacterium]